MIKLIFQMIIAVFIIYNAYSIVKLYIWISSEKWTVILSLSIRDLISYLKSYQYWGIIW